MLKAITAALAIILIFAPEIASACSYPDPPTFKSRLIDATSVFVFRLDRAEYKRKELGAGAYTTWIDGTIKPIQNLYGHPTKYKKINFSSGWCGGVNLVVGHHYLVATKSTGDTIELVDADGSIVDIEGFYDPDRKRGNLRSLVIFPVIKAIYGVEPLPDTFPPVFFAERTVLQAPPAPKPH